MTLAAPPPPSPLDAITTVMMCVPPLPLPLFSPFVSMYARRRPTNNDAKSEGKRPRRCQCPKHPRCDIGRRQQKTRAGLGVREDVVANCQLIAMYCTVVAVFPVYREIVKTLLGIPGGLTPAYNGYLVKKM